MEDAQEKEKREKNERILRDTTIEDIKEFEQRLDSLLEKRNFMLITNKQLLDKTESEIKAGRK